jgi:uroporphyrin-III C-methyltransferase
MNDPRTEDPRDGTDPGSTERSDPGGLRERPAPAPEASTTRSLGVVLGLLALIIAFASAGGALFTWWQVDKDREAAALQRTEAADRLSDLRELLSSAQERLATQERRLGALDQEADERRRALEALDGGLRQARARLEALAREEAGPERAPSIAEIEFLLLLASRELALGDNPRVALAALREADRRVGRLEEPGLADVRAAINDEIAAVEAVAEVDIEGIALRLASLARRVEGLPLRASLSPAPAERAVRDLSGWDRFVDRLRGLGAGLFRIRRTDAPAAPLLAPDESFFLYRNVELDLKSARLAALARDPGNYAASLDAARRALEEYFELRDEAVRSLLAAIEELEERDIAPQWPEISRSLALLRVAGTEY